MRLICVIFMSLGVADPRHVPAHPIRKWIQSLSVPWVGVLSYRETALTQETITGITLIKKKLGLANSYDVAHISKSNIRNTTRAMFIAQEGVLRYAAVTDYDIHPEFNEDTLNTVALVHLDYDEDMFDCKGVATFRSPDVVVNVERCGDVKRVLMDWPNEGEQMKNQLGNVYAFGYIDDRGALEQVMQAMEIVNRQQCDEFYKREDLDSQWMTPTKYECFGMKFSSEKCVYESGMTLALHHAGRWKLLGMSILGPGCALPARFIDFARYVSWAQQALETHRVTRRSRVVRRGRRIHHM